MIRFLDPPRNEKQLPFQGCTSNYNSPSRRKVTGLQPPVVKDEKLELV
jgi:hypothetical protein